MDTGYYRSICNETFFNKLHVPLKLIRNGEHTCLLSANGSQMRAIENICVPIEIQGVVVQTRILVLNNLSNDIILGLTFLNHNKCNLDFVAYKARFFNDFVQVNFNNHLSIKIACAVKDVIIPPHSQFVLNISVPRCMHKRTAFLTS